MAAKEKYGNLEFLDFSANINPLGPPPGVFEAIRDNIPSIIHYPEPEGKQFKLHLSKRLGVAEEHLILGNGAVELIYLLAHTLAPQTALIPSPTFSEYTSALKSRKTACRLLYTSAAEDFRLDPASLDLKGADILFICNPNNPTGYLLPESDFVQILAKAEQENTFLVVDESFMDFVEVNKQWRASDYLKRSERLFVIYSLTKFYAIPGLRLGCGIGNPALIRQIKARKDPWNVNSLALAAGTAALEDTGFEQSSRSLIKREREFLAFELDKLPGLKPFPAVANFMLVQNLGQVSGLELVDRLGSLGILIRDCSTFPGLNGDFFRIAVKDRESNTGLIDALTKVLYPR